jgi:hypothetical protein
MFKNHLFNLFIAVALLIVVALTVREVYATSITISQTTSASRCDELPSRYSIHTEPIRATGTLLTSTEDGPTGVDGGLNELFTAYRTCSQ